jgi:hypothetical protein
MRASIALVALVLLGFIAPAQAKFTPVDAQALAISSDDTAIDSGASGALLEAHYFSAPQPFAARRMFPCRLQVRMFDKTRMAESCN